MTSREDSIKLLHDTFKHLTTLATGSILIVATFVDKIFDEPQHQWLLIVMFIGLVISILSSVLFMIVCGVHMRNSTDSHRFEATIGTVGFCFSVLGFLCGIVCLAVFTTINLGLNAENGQPSDSNTQIQAKTPV